MHNQQKAFIEKILQYGMLAVLLLCAFFLPGFSARQNTADDASASLAPVSAQDHGKGTIVLDPGHGGDDPGMTGKSKITEKALNLIYAKKLAQLFTDAGYRVVLTRETEDGLYDADSSHKKAQDMQKRILLIQEVKPVLTVSIHQNSYEDSRVKGPQVFYYRDSPQGEKLAKILQEKLNENLQVERPREAKGNTTYYLLRRSPGVLNIVECGFLTNPEEAAMLSHEEYQQKVAEAVADGVVQYMNGMK